LIYANTQGQIVFFDLFIGKEISTIQAHDSYISSLGISPDGSVVCSAGVDSNMRLWSAINFDAIHTYGAFNKKPCLFGKVLDTSELSFIEQQVVESVDYSLAKPDLIEKIDGISSLCIGALYGDGIFRMYSTASRLDPVVKMKGIATGNSTKNFAVVDDYVIFPIAQGGLSFWRANREVYRSPIVHADDCGWVAASPEGFGSSQAELLASCGLGVDCSTVIWRKTDNWEEVDVSFAPVFPEVVGLCAFCVQHEFSYRG
jgi:WD40 repeat protein